MPTVDLRICGVVSLSGFGGFRSDKSACLAAYLATERRLVHRAHVASLLWPASSPERARSSLRQCVHELRGAFGQRLSAERRTIGFATPIATELDVLEAVSRPGVTLEAVAAALPYVRGMPLEGMDPGGDLGAWIRRTRATHRRLATSLNRKRADLARRLGDTSAFRAALEDQIAIAPTDESAHRRLAHLLAARGDTHLALAQLSSCREALSVDGLQPESATTALVGRIHAIRRGATPPSAPRRRRLVGRRTLRDEVAATLRRPSAFVTLVGEPGVGKTELARAVAEDAVADHLEGVAWTDVEDVPFPDRGSLIHAIGRAAGAPGATARTSAGLLTWLSRRSCLVVVDGFDPSHDSGVLDELSAGGAGLCLLVTARSSVGGREGKVVAVPPLTAAAARRLAVRLGAGEGEPRRGVPREIVLRAAQAKWAFRGLGRGARLRALSLSVFAGPFHATDADAITGSRPELLDALTARGVLVRLRGLHRMPGAYRREAEAKLSDEDRDALRARHRDAFRELAAARIAALRRQPDGEPWEPLDRRRADIVMALERVRAEEGRLGALDAELVFHLHRTGSLSEEAAHRLLADEGPFAAEVALACGDIVRAAAIARAISTDMRATYVLGEVARLAGELDRAQACYEAACAVALGRGAVRLLLRATHGLGLVALSRGDVANARRVLRQAERLAARLGSVLHAAPVRISLAEVALAAGEFRHAEALSAQVLSSTDPGHPALSAHARRISAHRGFGGRR